MRKKIKPCLYTVLFFFAYQVPGQQFRHGEPGGAGEEGNQSFRRVLGLRQVLNQLPRLLAMSQRQDVDWPVNWTLVKVSNIIVRKK